jgi:DNA-binding transcriptional regulator of glucitol operon
MSLKSFHVFFIVSAFLLSLFLGGWSLNEYVSGSRRTGDLILALVSIGGAVALVFYGRYFLKKLKNVDYF